MRELTEEEAREQEKYINWGFKIDIFAYNTLADQTGEVAWTWVITNIFGVQVDYGFADTKAECEVQVKIAKAQAVLRGDDWKRYECHTTKRGVI